MKLPVFEQFIYYKSESIEYNVILEQKLMEVIRVLLPNKYIHEERTIIKAGGRLISLLEDPMTVTQVWEKYKIIQDKSQLPQVPFDLFILTLDFLYAIGAIEFKKGKLWRLKND